MITLQFSSTSEWASRAIRFLTWSWASHVDFVLPDGKLFGALGVEGGGGVRFHELRERSHYTRIERFEVDAPDTVLEYALSQAGKPYDWAGIFGYVARNRKWEDEDKWFCSELAAWAFQKAGVPLLNETSYRVTPRDVLISPLLKPVEFSYI